MTAILILIAAALLYQLTAVVAALFIRFPAEDIRFSGGRIIIRFRETRLPLSCSMTLRVTNPTSGESDEIRIKAKLSRSRELSVDTGLKPGAAAAAELSNVRVRVMGSPVDRRFRKSLTRTRSAAKILFVQLRKTDEQSSVGAPEGVREFAHGDRLRDLHMKLSAKCGKYMVRERGSSYGYSVEEKALPPQTGKPSLTFERGKYPVGAGDTARASAACLLWLAAMRLCFGSLPVYCIVFAAALLAVRAAGIYAKKYRAAFLAAFYIMLAAPGVMGAIHLTSQLGRVLNLLSSAATARLDRLLPLTAVGDPDAAAACFLTALAVWSLSAAAGSRRIAVRALFGAVMLLPAAIFGQAEVMLVGLMSAILAFAPWRGYGARGAVLPLISAAAACVAFAAPIGLNAADSAGLFADELRFGGGIAQPSGRISEVSQPSGDAPALEVIMDSPEALYLHGFTGCSYENGSWSTPHSDELAASQGELLALQKAGFTADSQPLRLLQSGGEDIRTQKVTVRRLGANGKYAYISDGADTVGSDYPAGLEIPADGDITEFTAVCDIFSAAESFPEAAAKADDGYLANAAALDGIYRGSYTQLPDTVERVLEARLGRHGGVDIAEASALVYRLLDGCEYDAAALPQTAESFLQETRAGNSCAYASAAVLAFRYLGVPARYAEGYALTKAHAESAAAGSAMTLTADDFHAWAEYYVEGAGWLPFEVVPEYLDKMPHSRLNTELSGGSRGASGSGAADEQSGGRVYNRLPDDEEETSVRSAMWIFPAAAAALLLIYLVYLLLRLELDPAYALAKCAARLGLSHDTAGRYDISYVSGRKRRERLERLQRLCIEKYYSRSVTARSGGAAAYLSCIAGGRRKA